MEMQKSVVVVVESPFAFSFFAVGPIYFEKKTGGGLSGLLGTTELGWPFSLAFPLPSLPSNSEGNLLFKISIILLTPLLSSFYYAFLCPTAAAAAGREVTCGLYYT